MECETQQQRIRELEPALDGIALGGMPHGSDCAYWCNEPCDCLTAREVM